MTKHTISDIAERLVRVESKLDSMSVIVTKLEKQDIGQKAVESYIKKQSTKSYSAHQLKNTKTWIEVGKQLLYILGIIGTILYTVASTRGIE